MLFVEHFVSFAVRIVFESNWLNIESQSKLTLNFESIWLKYSPITQNPGVEFKLCQWLNFLLQHDSSFFFKCYNEALYCNKIWIITHITITIKTIF